MKSPKKGRKKKLSMAVKGEKAVHWVIIWNHCLNIKNFFLTIINLVQIVVTLVHCNTMRASDIVYLSDKKETYYLLCMPMTKNQGVHSLHQAELLVRLMHHHCIYQTNCWYPAFSFLSFIYCLPMCWCTYCQDEVNDIRTSPMTFLHNF